MSLGISHFQSSFDSLCLFSASEPDTVGFGHVSRCQHRAHWLRFSCCPDFSSLPNSLHHQVAHSFLQFGFIFRMRSLLTFPLNFCHLFVLFNRLFTLKDRLLHPEPELVEMEPWCFSPNHVWSWLLPRPLIQTWADHPGL